VALFDGSTTIKGRKVDVDVDFNDFVNLVRRSEIPKDLLQLNGIFEARKGRFSVFTDVAYLKLGLDESMTRSHGADELNGLVGASAGLKLEIFIAQMAAAYEVARWGSNGTPVRHRH